VTDLLTAPAEPGSAGDEPEQGGRSVVLAAAVAAGWAAAVGLIAVTVVVLVAWTTDTRSGSSTGQAVRTAALGWLLAHGAPVRTSGLTVSLIPTALTGLQVLLLARAGRSLARALAVRTLRAAATAVAATAAAYGLIALVVAGVSGSRQAWVELPRALVAAALLAAAATGYGVLRGAGLTGELGALFPAWLPTVTRAAVATTAGWLAAGAVTAAAGLVLSAGRVRALFDALGPGVAGGLVLGLLALAYAPTAAVWGAAYLAGPGFAVGAGTQVGVFGVTLGTVPAFPLLGALPAGPHPTWWPLLVVAAAAGLFGGVVVGRSADTADDLNGTLLRAAASAPAAGLLAGFLAFAAGGAVGANRLSALGPSPWQVAGALAAETAVPAVIGAWWAMRRR